MPRIISDGHPECYIDCPGKGYAYYEGDYGPCETGCDEEEAASRLGEIVARNKGELRISGRVSGMRGRTVGWLAILLEEWADLPRSGPDLDWLRQIARRKPDEAFDLHWQDADLVALIAVIADQTGRLRPLFA